ncbi:hypothetical protein [Rubripirellula amarantea]|nr:hypothetical protein [Rubripirellula amarantea]
MSRRIALLGCSTAFALVAALGSGVVTYLHAQSPIDGLSKAPGEAQLGTVQDDSNRRKPTLSAVTPTTKVPGSLMRLKLESSHEVMEGLLRRDFDKIAEGARQMKRISEAAEWPRARDEVYEHFSQTFRRQCIQLESLASQRNHEGVTFTYLGMTKTCVDCHDYVRDSRKIAGPQEGDVRLIPSHWPERVSGR